MIKFTKIFLLLFHIESVGISQSISHYCLSQTVSAALNKELLISDTSSNLMTFIFYEKSDPNCYWWKDGNSFRVLSHFWKPMKFKDFYCFCTLFLFLPSKSTFYNCYYFNYAVPLGWLDACLWSTQWCISAGITQFLSFISLMKTAISSTCSVSTALLHQDTSRQQVGVKINTHVMCL